MKQLAATLFVLLSMVFGIVGTARANAPDPNAACFDCHADEQKMKFENGEEISVLVKPDALAASVHAKKLLCTDCHLRNSDYPHKGAVMTSHRAYTLAQYEMCRKCHFANYTRALEGVHYKLQSAGNTKAPVCIDCHGAHDIKPPAKPRLDASQRCGSCHKQIFDTYAKSAHGKALVDQHNEDVPVCTDCHRAHDIADPRLAGFKLNVPNTCGRCHADEKRMQKYGLSTHVVDTYLSDFHGVTAKMYRDHGQKGGVVAGCTDCHGVHDIASVRGRPPGEMKARLQAACTKCHKGTGVNFPDSWLGHYEPSPTKAPLVFAVKVFYWIMIPLVIGGLLLQMFLHIWRIAVNR